MPQGSRTEARASCRATSSQHLHGLGDGWADPDTEKSYYSKGPGLAADAAAYLAEQKVVLIALDNPFTDAVAEGSSRRRRCRRKAWIEGRSFVIHHTNLAVNGIHQIQNANLTAIAADKGLSSCTMILPLREQGHAGSPVRPVAIGVPRGAGAR